jgi:hypothetical protein
MIARQSVGETLESDADTYAKYLKETGVKEIGATRGLQRSGGKGRRVAFLDAAYKERASLLIYLGVRPTFDNIRSDPHFADLLRRMGLPQASVQTPS